MVNGLALMRSLSTLSTLYKSPHSPPNHVFPCLTELRQRTGTGLMCKAVVTTVWWKQRLKLGWRQMSWPASSSMDSWAGAGPAQRDGGEVCHSWGRWIPSEISSEPPRGHDADGQVDAHRLNVSCQEGWRCVLDRFQDRPPSLQSCYPCSPKESFCIILKLLCLTCGSSTLCTISFVKRTTETLGCSKTLQTYRHNNRFWNSLFH